MEFYDAWQYLNEHVIFKDEHGFSRFQECIDIEVVKVNPETKAIDDNETLNTKTRVWIECGPYKENTHTHDIDLDCGAKSFEKAIIKLAKLVKKVYGNKKKAALLKVQEKYNENWKFDEKQLRL